MSPTPRFAAVATDLRQRIHAGEFDHHGLPTHRRLMGAYGISRGTLRAALDQLTVEGLLIRQQGSVHRVRRLAVGTIVVVDVSLPVEVTAGPGTDKELADLGLPAGAWVIRVGDLTDLDEAGEPRVIAVHPATTRVRLGATPSGG